MADSRAKLRLNGKKQNWRLKKTLNRKTSFRPIEAEDMKWIWAAYQKGGLDSLGPRFKGSKFDVNEFRANFTDEVVVNYGNAWTLFADNGSGSRPVGIILAFWTHQNPLMAPFQIIGDVIRFPWVSKRCWFEAVTQFYAKIQFPSMIYAHGDDSKRLMEVIAKHGLVRRVGTTFNVVHGQPVAVFETRKGR